MNQQGHVLNPDSFFITTKGEEETIKIFVKFILRIKVKEEYVRNRVEFRAESLTKEK